MLEVNFYDADRIDDALLKFAVIVSRHNGKWVFCKHRERDTYECPGGRREEGEKIGGTAKRELWEETGAVRYDIRPVCVYAVAREGAESFGMLYFADIYEFEELPSFEIEKIELFSALPGRWTYPLIQPKLLEKAKKVMQIK